MRIFRKILGWTLAAILFGVITTIFIIMAESVVLVLITYGIVAALALILLGIILLILS